MFARVNIEEDAWTNPKFAILANVLGFADGHHALIKCAVLWSWQTDNFTADAPTYIVDADTIDACLGRPNAGPAMVRAKLAEETPDGYRIRGSKGRIEWLSKCRLNAKKGGESRRSHPGTPVGVICNQDNKEDPPGYPPGLPPGNPPGLPPGDPSLVLKRSKTVRNSSRPVRAEVEQVSPEAWTAADTLRRCVLKARPGNIIGKEPWSDEHRQGKRLKWAKQCHELLTTDRRTTNELGDVLRFLFQEQSGNFAFDVQSPSALREKWDRITSQMARVKRGGPSITASQPIQISPETAARLTSQPSQPFLGIALDDESGEEFS